MMRKNLSYIVVALFLSLAACAKKPAADTPQPAQMAPEATNVPEESPQTAADSVTSSEISDIDRTGTGIAVQSAGTLDTIYFDYDSFVLSADARKILEKNARLLRNDTAEKIVIKGHTDERGSDAYNLALGERRARAAYNYLVALGIPADRLSILSYGEEQPAVSGHDEESWARNRRAQF
jgi:peptidoglycan-associated lipoprotein